MPSYPYLPYGRSFLFVSGSNPFMEAARNQALAHSLDGAVKTGAVVVHDRVVVGAAANGSDYHHECERVKQGIPTGQGYELCEGCHPKNHAERRAVERAGTKAHGADLYLWGHWWACEPCWDAIAEAGIRDVFLHEDSARLFDKENPENILGRWDAYEHTH
jgi:deoxycytidylate deaminase